ncbi:MAG: response regulator [Selenomonadaceae bacterium]|nr:response regulator [Selenomonadaceae bacterium]
MMEQKFFKDWQILKSGRRSDFIIIIAITAIFLFVIAMNVRLIFQMTSNQTEQIGQMQLEGIRSDLQGTITKAENFTVQMAMEVEQMLSSGASYEDFKNFFYQRKNEQLHLTDGVCFNVYITTKDWTIIPDFSMPADYHAKERLWYKGAAENPGKIYITEPYIDAMSGIMCFTMSKMLPDNETVVALDFNFSDVQQSILRMNETGDQMSLIVTKSGMIIGYTDMSLVGEKISKKLPAYESILARVVQSQTNESFVAQIDGREHTIFSSETNNGWYMIVSVDNLAFYRDSYRQIIFTMFVSLVMMLAIIFFYLNAMKNGLQAETALHVKEEFLSRLSRDLREPLHKILKLSSADESLNEKAAQVRESALKLSDMLDNLFSFSTIVSSDKTKLSADKKFHDGELAKVSRYSRNGVIAVLVAAMLLAAGLCIKTTISWGDTKMKLEADTYEHQLVNWIENQRSILGMFVNILGKHPEFMDDYPSAVKFLNDLAKKYPEISVCYMSNPYKEHILIMNNGWQPDENFDLETRPWYIAAEKSEDGFSISAPYYDAQTGLYCVTLSQIVYGDNDEFIGIFGIDFYIDSLIKVLGESYSKDGYAFLVDSNGIIINHPNPNYQMSESHMTNIFDTEYAKVFASDNVATMEDYTKNFVACLAKKNPTSNFTVIVANSWWNIYGDIILLGGLFIALLGICIAIVSMLIHRLFGWQDSVNNQLKEISDTAVAASKAKSQFLAQMSHEIRTPINAVLGMNEMILRESHDKNILDYSANIQSAGKTLLTLINSILDFSKIEDGKMEIVPVRYETTRLIDDLVNMISERVRKKGLEFKTQIESTLPKSLYGDDVRIRQIITNLLTNAVKYTHEGSITFKISGSEIDADTYELQVAVIDTGIGIREQDMDKLFQSFQRIDEERNRNIEGTGLGIAIVQKLLAMMNSKLEVASVYGKGSTFSFKLIQKIIDKNYIGNYDEQKINHGVEDSNKKFLVAPAAKILAVDDNDMNLKVISGLLKRNGIVPDLAESGMQCIQLAKEKFYHIIFLDHMMPIMNGIETLKELQRENILSDKTSVVMLTAGAIAGMREQYLREGFNDYLSKPIEVAELETILEKHLPADIVSFKIEGQEKISAQIEEVKTVEENSFDDENLNENFDDTFTAADKKSFNESCPDINLEVGLPYCMDSKEFYIEMLKTFVDGQKAEQIQAAFDSGDWKNYQILVHALKSTSLSIGAENLSEQARHLELAAKDDNIQEIQANHADLMMNYAKVRDQISKWLEGCT